MRHFAVLALTTSTTLALTAGLPVARADAPAPAAKPAFAMMDNTGDGSEVDLSFPISIATKSIATNDGPDAVIRPRLLVQGFEPNGFGGYGILDASSAIGNVDQHGTGIGNFELGGLYHATINPRLDIGVRVGFAFATANEGFPQVINEVSDELVRPADLATSARAGRAKPRAG